MPCPAVQAVMVSRLDRCRDQVIDGFKRYAALAVVARNLQHIGALLLAQEAETARGARERQRRRAARPCRSG
jgi:transposase, IS5 family